MPLTNPPREDCGTCNGHGWYFIEGATKYPLTETCACKLYENDTK